MTAWDEEDEEARDPAEAGPLALRAERYLAAMEGEYLLLHPAMTPPLVRLALAVHESEFEGCEGGPSPHLEAVAFTSDYPTAWDVYEQASCDPFGLARLAQERTIGILEPGMPTRAAIRAAARELVLALQTHSFD